MMSSLPRLQRSIIAAAALLLSALGVTNPARADASGPADMWPGVAAMTGGKGYAPTPMGQVHYRDIGPRDSKTTVLLLHMTPMSIMEVAGIQNALADLGIRAIAIDTPGYGMSDQPKGLPTVEDFADNIVPVLDYLKVQNVVVGGHHTGAEIALSLAVRHPDRVKGLILHGLPMFTREEGDARLAKPEWDRRPKADGSHMDFLFKYRKANGEPPTEGELMAKTWMAVLMYLEGKDIGHHAAYLYDMARDLKTYNGPGLIISDAGDAIHNLDLEGVKMRPDFSYRELSQGNTGEIMIQPKKWADFAAEFIKTSVH